jgi:hypothetical protein
MPRALVVLAPVALAVALLVGGCSSGGGPSGADRSASSTGTGIGSGTAAPRLGGDTPTPSTPPGEPMDDLEKPVAGQLSSEVARQGLKLEYLDCPPWDQNVPRTLSCRGYFDGVPAVVRVRLTAGVGGQVSFSAALQHGLIATRNLVRTLKHQGYDAVDCGDVPAYPAVVGSTLNCRVTKAGRTKYVVATVVNRGGRVTIADY